MAASAANADSLPADPTNPKTPATVSAVSLPTPQIDGVVWTQTVVGNTVFVGGDFTTARPDGAAPGTSTVTRTSILAYDIRTGLLISRFAPVLNGEVYAIVASADAKHIYIGGAFTTVNGVARGRVAELSSTTGALVKGFAPSANRTVRALALRSTTLYVGGDLFTMNGKTRSQIAAVSATTGALSKWAPKLVGGQVTSIALSPAGTRIVLGGQFTSVNGSSTYGYGLASLVRSTGAVTRWAAVRVVRNGGKSAGITSLTATPSGVVGTGYTYGAGGNFEGMFRADWKTGKILMVENCRGDTYDSAVQGDVVYIAGHTHTCSSLGAFRNTSPETKHRALAFTLAATGALAADATGIQAAFNGQPSPSLLNWYPELTVGTYTGKQQAAWSVAANSSYVLYGGEFTAVNGRAQQGLARFAVPSRSPNTLGPISNGAGFVPTLTSNIPGAVTLGWTANADPDNATLDYRVYRDGDFSSPVYETSADSSVWFRPRMTFTDRTVIPGRSYSYRLVASDPFGNSVKGDGVSITAAAADPARYAGSVLSDAPTSFWRFSQNTGTTVSDEAGLAPLTLRGTSGPDATASSADGSTATRFSGAPSSYAGANAPSVVSASGETTEAWVKIAPGEQGGVVVDLGDSVGRASDLADRTLYIDTAGRPGFDLRSGTAGDLLAPQGIADGQWHQLAVTVTTKSIQLYVDGSVVASKVGRIPLTASWGYWRVAGDRSTVSKPYLTGSVDDVALYPRALAGDRVAAHFAAAKPAAAG